MMDKQHDRGTAAREGLGSSVDDIPVVLDHLTIAIESLRTQWRTVVDLGTHERMAVSQLRVYGSMPMSELASRIALSRAAVTSLVDRLEANGWVRREADDLDRRRTVLKLTNMAVERYAGVNEAFNADALRIIKSFDEREATAIISFVQQLTSYSEREAGQLRATAVERSLS